MKTAKRYFFCAAAALALLLVAAGALLIAAHAAPAAELYYFINCGAAEITDAETAFGLTGQWGSGDKAYGAGESGKSWGYRTAGDAGASETDSVFSSYVTGSPVYEMQADAGSYTLSLGFVSAEGASVTVSGEAQAAVTLTEKGVKSYPVTLSEAGAVTVSVSGGKLAFIALTSRDAKVLLHAEATEAEVIEYGSVVGGEAAAYFSDGTTGTVPLDYKNLSADDVNRNFMMTEATARFAGTTAEVKRTLLTMPKNLVYYVNCGSVTGDAVAENNDVYYSLNRAVFDKFSGTLLNDVIDQELTGSATWGYTPYSSDFLISSKQMPAKTGDPYPPPYPFNTIRCTDKAPYAIEYTFALTEGTYNLYLGTRSHWHARKATLTINGETVETFNLEAKSRVALYKVTPKEGKVTVKVSGAQLDEGNIAFLAVQPSSAENDPAAVPALPSVPESLGMGETDFTVSGAAEGTKIQVSLAEKPFAVIYEGAVTEAGDYVVSLDPAKIEGIYKLNVAAVSSGGASGYAKVFITDITDFTAAVSDTGWTSGNVNIALSARAASGLTRLEVTHDFITTEISLPGTAEYEGSYAAEQNGVYDFVIYSGNNAFFSRSVTVSNIDRAAATLSASVLSYSGDKAVIRLTLDSAAGAETFRVYSMGKKLSEAAAVPERYEAAAGEYTFAVTTLSGKTASATVTVSVKPAGFKPVQTAGSSGAKVTVEGRGGSEVAKIFAYRVDESGLTRLTVTGKDFNVYESGEYAIMAVYTDGTSEISRLTIDVKIGAGGDDSDGLPGWAIALVTVSCVVVAAVIGGAVFLIIRRKKAATPQIKPPQDNE